MTDIHDAELSVDVQHSSFEEWWDPFELGVGPAGSYVSSLESAARQRLMERCHELLPSSPFVVTASAWAARGSVASH
jgi:hypothetical protein